MKRFFLFFIHCNFFLMGFSQKVLPLYKDSIPNSKPVNDEEHSETDPVSHILRISKVSRPDLTVFLPPPEKANGTAVIICPGGGYSIIAAGHEGYDVAKLFNGMGVAAFVLKYRIPSDAWMIHKETGPLQDAQRAIQFVRENANSWHLNPERIGIMGFSAGGHLASTAGTHFTHAVIDNKNNISLRPDFMILIYPVISFADSLAHMGSRDNLLGKHPSAEKIKAFSNEQQVTDQTPPAFLVHAGDDPAVKVQNSLYFYEALVIHHVAATLHLYPKGGHGFGLHNHMEKDEWTERLKDWMDNNGWLGK